MYTKIGKIHAQKIMADTRWTEIIQFEKIKGQISTKIFDKYRNGFHRNFSNMYDI